MKTHQVIFDKTHALLEKYFGDKLTVNIEQYDDGYKETHLTITNSDIWISCDDSELTIGSEFNHRHFNPDFDNMNEMVDDLFNLLTQKKKITEYYKGNICYKKRTEIEIGESKYKELSTSLTWFFPFWKSTKEKVFYEDKLIDKADILTEINEIKNYAQQSPIIQKVTTEDIINQYIIESKLNEKQIGMILENENLRISTIEYLREKPNRNFTIDFLKFIISKRKEEYFEIATSENMMYASYLVGLHKNIEDSELIWKAKNVDFDMYCGLDVQLIVFAGVDETIKHFSSLKTDESIKALEYITECKNAQDFDDIDGYFSHEELPWWI